MKKCIQLFILVALFIPVMASAQIQSAATGNWSDVATWVGGVVPKATDDVSIETGHKVTLNTTTAECKNLTIVGSLEFQIDGTVSGITVNGDVNVKEKGVFRATTRNPAGQANSSIEHLFTLKGNLTVEATGTLDFRGGSNSAGTTNAVLTTFAGTTNSEISLQNSKYVSSTSSSSGKYGEEFNSITINKTGGAKVILKAGNLYASNNSSVGATVFTLTSGKVETVGTSIFGYLSTSGPNFLGASKNSYVAGTLGRGLSNGGGSVRRDFPVGDNGGIRKVVIGSMAPGNATGHLLTVKCITGNANNSSTFAGGINKVSEVRYYEVSYTRSGISTASTSVTLDSVAVAYGADDGVKSGNINLRVAYSIDNRATWTGVQQTNPYVTLTPGDTTVVGGDLLTSPINIKEGETIYLALARVSGTTENSLAGGTDVEKEEALPSSYTLGQNYPNPFNPSTVISYQLPAAGAVTLKVYDVLGNEVSTLVDEFQQAGTHNAQFSITNSQLSSGVYFYKLQADGFVSTKKMVLIK
ncbi:MAG: T9SS type A sorting domain-containing protein [Melioribacteraceae bacterium]